MLQNKSMYIDGSWSLGGTTDQIKVRNPASLEEWATVPNGDAESAKLAVTAASRAFTTWRDTTAFERSRLLKRWHQIIMERSMELAETMTLEQGKPLKEAEAEVKYAADFVEWYAEEGKRVFGNTMPSSSSGKRLFTIRQPVGVVAAITPWNFPISMITRKVAPALAAGCTCVVKPASETPLTALLLAEMAEEAGFPDGVLNIITGDAKVIGEQLLADERVAKITFTGSTAVGKVIMAQAADTVKRISLELGGHAPIIVHDDADIHMAVMETVNNKFRNAGQTCICANRVYVHASIFDDFEKALTEEVTKLQVGNGLEEGVDIGPLINKDGFEQVKQHVDQAVSLGAKVVTGGRQIMVEGNEGYFYEPTVITKVTQGMKILKEETFGPVVPIIPFHTDEEAVRLANDTPYGLAAYIFTTNINRAIYTAENLEYGIIGINDGAPSAAELPFGGMKQSGFGREGGREGIDMYLETKSISLGGL